MNESLIAALRAAIAADPTDIHIRLHLGRLLLEDGQAAESVSLASAVLQLDPAQVEARALMSDALAFRSEPAGTPASDSAASFDWSAAEKQVDDVAQPMFVGGDDEPEQPFYAPERSTITLADVGGARAVKERLNSAFLAPLRNPELRKLYAKSLRGGLLMYGPPGCGKTFIARAVAGELGANFLSVSLADVLDPFIGNSEKNVHDLFETARASQPCVIFLDEIDAIGQRRSATRNSGMRGTVNQLLLELDGMDSANEGVFVLAATNQPWDVDPALRRPGRLDRTILVLPPDQEAREEIFRYHLSSRPIEGVDLGKLAKASDGLTGADIAFVCEVSAENALMDSAATGQVRMITMTDVQKALAGVTSSIGPWLDSARNVVMFGNDDGTYDELKKYLKQSKRL